MTDEARQGLLSVIVPARNCAAQLRDCLTSLAATDYPTWEVIVVDDASDDETAAVAAMAGARCLRLPSQSGPAVARNRGAALAHGEFLFFLDADVCVHPDTLHRAVGTLQGQSAAAVFGSYDESPRAGNWLSQYKNLCHHHVHQTSSEQASTFWSGCGAVRRSVFQEMNGFDESYSRPCVEDIELGIRLNRAGHRIALAKDVQATHLKRWTLWGMVRCDVWDRAVPWTRLLLRERSLPNDLNLRVGQRICTVLAYLLLAVWLLGSWQAPMALLLPVFLLLAIHLGDAWSAQRRPLTGLAALASLGAATMAGLVLGPWLLAMLPLLGVLVLLNLRLHLFLARRGAALAVLAVPLQLLYYLYCGVGLGLGVFFHLSQGNSRLPRFALLASADLAAKSFGFVATLAIVRAFGAEGLGTVHLAQALLACGLIAAACGLNVHARRRVARDPAALSSTLSTVVVLRLLGAVAVYGGFLLLALVIPPLRSAGWLWPLFGLSLFTGALMVNWAPEALQETRVVAGVNVATQGLALALLLGGLWGGGGLWVVPVAQVIAELTVAGVLLMWVGRRSGLARPLPLRRWPRLLSESLPMAWAKLMRAAVLASDLFLLGLFVGPAELGHYAGAFRLYLLGVSLAAVFSVMQAPRLARQATRAPDSFLAELRGAQGTVALVALPMLLLGLPLAGLALRLLFGDGFISAAGPLRLLLLALVAGALANGFRNALVALERQQADSILTTLATAGHLLAKVLLIPWLGLIGAAAGTLVGEALLLALAGGLAWSQWRRRVACLDCVFDGRV